MIDHIILTVSDFERSVAFYAKALKPLGITNFVDYEGRDGHPDLRGFGDGKRAFFWLKKGKPDPQAVHVGFVAKDHAEVDAFYKAAVGAGGKSKESPQARPEYYPGYYATWVLDPDDLKSPCKNTPFDEARFSGRVARTIVGGFGMGPRSGLAERPISSSVIYILIAE